MKERLITAVIAVLLTLGAVSVFTLGLDYSALAGDVTLVNPGLEAPYPPFDGEGELKTASGWSPWWAPSTKRPEYLPELILGQEHQKQFTTFGAVNAGVYQEVRATPGQWYTFSVWVLMQSTDNQGDLSAMACINPWARWDIEHRTTVCGREIVGVYGEWVLVSVTAQAFTDKITVATWGTAKWPVKYNDHFWKDARLEQVTIGGICPTPEPCATGTPVLTPVAQDCATVTEIEELLKRLEWGPR